MFSGFEFGSMIRVMTVRVLGSVQLGSWFNSNFGFVSDFNSCLGSTLSRFSSESGQHNHTG
ncbi:hypothetical protein HanPSC8_Chr15g0688431 [Helianthus annuus]|nr:hypothetical protein HanPSC8_Chr15g0688431 [Helianthus annuus]